MTKDHLTFNDLYDNIGDGKHRVKPEYKGMTAAEAQKKNNSNWPDPADKALKRLAGMGGDAVVKKLRLEGQPEKIKAVHKLAQMGYKNVHDKLNRKPPTHKD